MKTREENQNQERPRIVSKLEADPLEIKQCEELREKMWEALKKYCQETKEIKLQVILNCLTLTLISLIRSNMPMSEYDYMADLIHKMIKEDLANRQIDVSYKESEETSLD